MRFPSRPNRHPLGILTQPPAPNLRHFTHPTRPVFDTNHGTYRYQLAQTEW